MIIEICKQFHIIPHIEDILSTCIDNLTAFFNAINTTFPKIEIQNHIIHQFKNFSKYVSYKDLKPVYSAVNENVPLKVLVIFAQNYNKNVLKYLSHEELTRLT